MARVFAAVAPRLHWARQSSADPADTAYPPHSHPPGEIYLPLSPGTWWNAGMDWTDPGVDGHIYNAPGILHAMRAGPAPFLALWALPI